MKGPAGPFSLACPAASAILADLVLERVDDLYAAVLERNRDEFEASGSPLALGCKQESARRNRPISLQPFGKVALRAGCGVANPRNSTAIAAVLRLSSPPAKPLSRREEIVNTFLGAADARLLQRMM